MHRRCDGVTTLDELVAKMDGRSRVRRANEPPTGRRPWAPHMRRKKRRVYKYCESRHREGELRDVRKDGHELRGLDGLRQVHLIAGTECTPTIFGTGIRG